MSTKNDKEHARRLPQMFAILTTGSSKTWKKRNFWEEKGQKNWRSNGVNIIK